MAWKIEISGLAQRNLRQLDPVVARRIMTFLKNRLAQSDDPRSLGQALRGSELGDLWKYRVGDYRIVSKIEDCDIQILVVKIGHRREVYR
jgi:mRNA interferase RelE/StbE